MTWLISDEARKHRAFREAWVAYILGGLYLLLGLYTEISEQNYSIRYPAEQKWYFLQSNIRSYGATLTAFLLAVGLPRLVCCEREYRTDDLVGTAALGRRYTWRAKTAFTVLYCAIVVFLIGAVSLLVNGGAFGFEVTIFWANNEPYHVAINNPVRIYEERLAEGEATKQVSGTQNITIGSNNKIKNSTIAGIINANGADTSKGFYEKHPVFCSVLISFLVGLILLFSFWDQVISFIEGLF
mgnify:CR=1 FL=1